MKTMNKHNDKKAAAEHPAYRGLDINAADDNKVDPRLVNEETRTLNNNPRSTE